MKYFGSKSVEQIDEDAIAAERLMAIAGRFKASVSTDEAGEVSVDSDEAQEAEGKPN